MKTISLKEYNKRYPDAEDNKYMDYHGDRPDLKGKRTMLEFIPNIGTCLLIEDLHFKIIGDKANDKRR